MTHGKKPLTPWQMLVIFAKHAWRDEPYKLAYLKCDEKQCIHMEFH